MVIKQRPFGQKILARLAQAKAWVRIVVQEDACPACRVHQGRVYQPNRVPRLPIAGCQSPHCRCRYEAVDPISKLPISELVERSAQLIRSGQRRVPLMALRRVVALDEYYEPGWLWLSAIVDRRERVRCLEKVLVINPHNTWAQKSLEALRQKLGLSSLPGKTVVIDIPLDVLHIRAERRVMTEQWQAFMKIIVEAAPKIAHDQAMAFLKRWEKANDRAIDLLFAIPALRDEAQQQWRELDQMGYSLGQAIQDFDAHTDQYKNAAELQEMFEALYQELRRLGQIKRKQLDLFDAKPT